MLPIALCVACRADSRSSESASTAASIPLVWFHSGSDAPEMQLRLTPDGQGRFTGGLSFLNPVRWSYDPAVQELRLRLSGVNAATQGVLRDGVSRGYALRFEQGDSTLVLQASPESDRIWVAGWYFFRDSL